MNEKPTDATVNRKHPAVPRSSPQRFFRNGRLVAMPVKRKNVRTALGVIVEDFELGRSYTEEEVNLIVLSYLDDHCVLRRALVNERFLMRDAAGQRYWRAEPL